MDTDYFPEDFPDGRTHDGFNLDPLGHLDAVQSFMTSGNKQTADRSSLIPVLDSCDYPQRATYSFCPLAVSDARHHATPSVHQPFQQEHAPFPALANASMQPNIATDMSIVKPYAGLNPSGDVWEHCKEEIQTLYASNTLDLVREKINSKYHLKASSKMYKYRINKWGYNKNLKDVEKAAILAGKGSEAQIRHIQDLPSKLKRYRKKMDLRTDRQALALRATTPPDLICRTPSPDPSLRMRHELEGPELVARAIQDYICGHMLALGIQVATDMIEVYSCLAREMRDTLGSHSLRYWDTCLDLVGKFRTAEEYQKAAELAETFLDDTAAANASHYRCRALRGLARAQKGLGKTTLAEKNMGEAVRISAEINGLEDPRTLRYLSRLGHWLEEWGRAEEAASIRTDHKNILVTMIDKHRFEEEELFQSMESPMQAFPDRYQRPTLW
ncbi:MAG: hypothetical protein OHK93_002503 [Ramalina farinacea]|uniref:Clr5 domain-containing protein n=1 Tax=Ramalina farinacea TaxID=258253 RepID=A0AA43TXA1_9LECA|nr:hypothetical protein [Ramalina farinacea]